MIRKIVPRSIQLNIDNWQLELNKPINKRAGYTETDEQFVYGQVCAVVVGTTLSSDEYVEMLFSLTELSNVHILMDDLDKTNDPLRFQALQRIINYVAEKKEFSVNRCLAFIDGENLIPFSENAEIHRHLLQAYKTLLETFVENHITGLADHDFRRVFIDTIKWIWHYLVQWLDDKNFFNDVPKLIWYGNMSKSESYFLYYLMLIGCDVVILHPSLKGTEASDQVPARSEAVDWFEAGEFHVSNLQVLKYPISSPLIPFPKEAPVRRSTVAYRAAQEMSVLLHSEDSLLYKPWQFRNYVPQPVTLKTTYDEAFLITKEKALVRPGFDVKGNVVQVPNLFIKIMGENSDRKQQVQNDKVLSEASIVHEITRFPFTKEDTSKNNMKIHYEQLLDRKRQIEPEKLMQSSLWKHQLLPSGLQLALASAVSRLCFKPKLKMQLNESLDDVRLFLFKQVAEIPKIPFITMMQQFDYSQGVPKLVLRTKIDTEILSRTDAAILLLLNEMGFDLFIFNQFGQNDIEIYINEQYFDTHWMENIVSPENPEETPAIKKFFSKFLRSD